MYTKLFVPFLKMNNLLCIYIDIEKNRNEKDRNKYMEKGEEQVCGNCCCNKT
jgi:hypothetical protein